MAGGSGSTGNVIAALANFFVPGLGHLIQGRVLGALFFFVVVGGLYSLSFFTLGLSWIAGALLHLVCILSAATYRPSTA